MDGGNGGALCQAVRIRVSVVALSAVGRVDVAVDSRLTSKFAVSNHSIVLSQLLIELN